MRHQRVCHASSEGVCHCTCIIQIVWIDIGFIIFTSRSNRRRQYILAMVQSHIDQTILGIDSRMVFFQRGLKGLLEDTTGTL